jgi:hypothetical protein
MGLGEVAVAATKQEIQDSARPLGKLALAAMALPGVMPQLAHAELAPEAATASLKWLKYNDSQPGLDRIHVNAVAANVLVPLGHQWSVDGTLVKDEVSGATPRLHTDVTSATKPGSSATATGMHDTRYEKGVKFTRYFERSAIGFGASNSTEHDYVSNAFSLDGRMASDDQNTTYNAGIGFSFDKINPVNQVVTNETKNSTDLMFGVTQAWASQDLVQLNLTHKMASGYMNDPYKMAENRPRERNQDVLLVRWNHHLPSRGTSVRSSYRYYSDTYGVRAHTVDMAYVMPLSDRLTVTPSGRYYAQRAASFYFDPVAGNPYAMPSSGYYSADQRLSAFGAVTVGAKVDYVVNPHWGVDFKYERYEQRSNWRATGKGSPDLDAFSATFLQLGLNYRF